MTVTKWKWVKCSAGPSDPAFAAQETRSRAALLGSPAGHTSALGPLRDKRPLMEHVVGQTTWSVQPGLELRLTLSQMQASVLEPNSPLRISPGYRFSLPRAWE